MAKYTYNPPYNQWSGNRSDTLNKWKVNYKGSIATASALPDEGEFKGDTYNVLEDGSNYMWNGTSWDKLDANTYVGATSEASGIRGLVPPATTSQMYSLLTGSGIWKSGAELGFAYDNAVVHLAGEETVEGLKVFSDTYINPETEVTASDVAIQDSVILKGTVPEKRHYISVVFTDSSGVVRSNEDRLAVIEYVSPFETANACGVSLSCYNFFSNLDEYSRIFVGYDNNLTPFATAPETSELRNGSYDILTRSWIPKDTRIVHTTGDEVVSGNKLFDNTLILKIQNATKGTFPASTQYKSILITDSTSSVSSYGNDKRFSQIRATILNNGASLLEFFAFKNETGSSDSTRISVGYDSDGNAYAIAPSTSSSRLNGGDIVTRDWIPNDARIVHTTGDEEIAGYKTFNNTIYVKNSEPFITCVNSSITSGTTFTGVRHFFSLGGRDSKEEFAYVSSYVNENNNTVLRLSARIFDKSKEKSVLELWSANNRNSFSSIVSNDILLGTSDRKWKEIWCTQSSINSSSDERIKSEIELIPDAVLDAWGEIQYAQFHFKDAVKEKGVDNARLHTGLVAQRVAEKLLAKNINPEKYGFYLYDSWEAQPEERDENGNVVQEAISAGDAYGLRYTEALCIEASYIRRENARLKAKLASLEERLARLEARDSE